MPIVIVVAVVVVALLVAVVSFVCWQMGKAGRESPKLEMIGKPVTVTVTNGTGGESTTCNAISATSASAETNEEEVVVQVDETKI